MITYWRNRVAGFLLVATMMLLSACGSGSGGGGIVSSSGSLAMTLNSTTVAAGNPVTATVTLTSLIAGSPVNGIKVQVSSNDASVIGTIEGYTNTNGIVNLQIPTMWVASDRIISLYATANGITPSSTVSLTVVAPKLTINIPTTIAPTTFISTTAMIGTTVTSGYTMKFVDGNGNPIPNQVISLYVDSLTGKSASDQIVYTPVQGAMIIAPPGVFTGTTDSSGNVSVPMYIQMQLPAPPKTCTTNPATGVETCTYGTASNSMTANWRAVAVYAGKTITTTGSSLITFTITGK